MKTYDTTQSLHALPPASKVLDRNGTQWTKEGDELVTHRDLNGPRIRRTPEELEYSHPFYPADKIRPGIVDEIEHLAWELVQARGGLNGWTWPDAHRAARRVIRNEMKEWK